MIQQILNNILRTKTTTLNIMIIILGTTFCFNYTIAHIMFLFSDQAKISLEFMNTKEMLMKDTLLIGFGALVKTGYDFLKTPKPPTDTQ